MQTKCCLVDVAAVCRARLSAIALAGLAMTACEAPSTPTFRVQTLRAPLTGPCPSGAVPADWQETNEIESFAATVTGPGMVEPVVAESTETGEPLLVRAIPTGPERVAALFGIVNGFPQWRGVSAPFQVEAGSETPLDVLLARVADVTCTRNDSQTARAFHTATLLADGKVLVVGGAETLGDKSSICAGCLEAIASRNAALYDPATGQFTPVGGLNVARMFHVAARLANGSVVVAGGAQLALLRPADTIRSPFPIVPDQVVETIELYDPAARAFIPVVVADPGGPRVFAAATTLPDGDVIITGGIPEVHPSRHDLGNALATSTVCTGEGFSCEPGPPLARARAGHAAFSTREGSGSPNEGRVFLWGGSVDLSPDAEGIDGHQFEMWTAGASSFALVEVAAMRPSRNLFFAATAQYLDFRVLSVGGLQRDGTTGEFKLAATDDGRGPVYVYDRVQGEFGALATGENTASGREAITVDTPLFFASATGLPDRRSAIVAGGFTSLTLTPSNELARYSENTTDSETTLSIRRIEVNAEPRLLREARGGVTATSVGDGSVLFVGGFTTADIPLATAEVYADVLVPPQAAPLPEEGR
jgi:hypothetical protein